MRSQKVPGGVPHQLLHFLVERGGQADAPSPPHDAGLSVETHHTPDLRRMLLKVMKSSAELLLLCVLTSLSPPLPAWAFSQGAKPSSCSSMEPGHIRAHPQDPQRSHVALHTPAHVYRPGDTLPVAVRSTRDFMGFLLQARAVRDDRVVGSFVLVPPGSRTLDCLDAGDTVTHSDKLLKRNLSFVWRAPDTSLGDVRFLITVVQSYFVYWPRIESDVVRDATENSIEDEVGGVRALPAMWAEPANQTGAADPGDSLTTAGQQGKGDPSLSTAGQQREEDPRESLTIAGQQREADPGDSLTTAGQQREGEPGDSLTITGQQREGDPGDSLTTAGQQREGDPSLSTAGQHREGDPSLSTTGQQREGDPSLTITGQHREGDPGLRPTLPTVSRGGPAIPAPPTGPGTFTLDLDHAQTRAESPRPSSAAAPPCLHCDQGGQGAQGAQGGQISVPPGLADPPPADPPQRSPLTAPVPQTDPAPSSPHLEPSPAPRRSRLDPATPPAPSRGTTPPMTPAPGSRVLQKGVVARNLSRGGDTELPGEGGAGGKGAKPPGGVSHRTALELGVLLGCASGLGMVLAVSLRYLHSQYCLKRTAVSLNEHHGNVIHLQDSGELVQIRKIRQNSFVLLQAEYNVMSPPGN